MCVGRAAGEPELAWFRTVVQQPVRSKVLGKVDLGQQVAVEVGRADREGPATGHIVFKNPLGFSEASAGFRAGPPRSQRNSRSVPPL